MENRKFLNSPDRAGILVVQRRDKGESGRVVVVETNRFAPKTFSGIAFYKCDNFGGNGCCLDSFFFR